MNDNNNIENLFKDAFDSFESNVDASVWNGVEQGIKNIPAAPASTVVKSLSVLKSVIAVIAVVAVATIAVVTYSILKTKSPEAIVTPLPTTETVIEKGTLNSENAVVYSPSEKTFVSNKNAVSSKVSEGKKVVENNSLIVSGTNALQTVAQQTSPDNSSATVSAPLQTNVQKQSGTTSTPPDNIKKQTEEPVKENPTEAVEPSESSLSSSTSNSNCDIDLSGNTFTPNGDEQGDVYRINDSNFREIHVKILDLRGKIVKQWDRLGGVWDGKLPNGNDAEIGRYIIIVNAVCNSGSAGTNKADIRLLRP